MKCKLKLQRSLSLCKKEVCYLGYPVGMQKKIRRLIKRLLMRLMRRSRKPRMILSKYISTQRKKSEWLSRNLMKRLIITICPRLRREYLLNARKCNRNQSREWLRRRRSRLLLSILINLSRIFMLTSKISSQWFKKMMMLFYLRNLWEDLVVPLVRNK